MGFGTQMTGWPTEFHAALADAGMRVIRFDNRDVGLTQKWDGILPDMKAVQAALREGKKPDVPYTLDDMAADAAGLLDELGIESAHIAGASMGGMIAQLVALNHPAKARSLISIFSTTGDPVAAALHAGSAGGADGAPAVERPRRRRSPIRSRGGAPMPRRAFRSTRSGSAQLIGASYDRSFYPEGTMRQWAAILAGPPRTERLKKLQLPALVLHGTADTLIPLRRRDGTRRECIPGAEYHEIEGWGHDMPLGVIPELRDLIVPFVRRVEEMREDGFAIPVQPAAAA